METLREEREEECNAAGLEEACTDRFDDQIEGEQQAMEEELDSMRKERDEALEAIETDKTEKVREWMITESLLSTPDLFKMLLRRESQSES